MPSGSRRKLRAALGRTEERVAVAVAEDEREGRGLQGGDGDGEIPRVLGDLALADRALLLQLLELRDDDTETCMMMLAVMYGMMPSAKMLKLANAPPLNRLKKPSAPWELAAALN
jgi:hypothetical protein